MVIQGSSPELVLKILFAFILETALLCKFTISMIPMIEIANVAVRAVRTFPLSLVDSLFIVFMNKIRVEYP